MKTKLFALLITVSCNLSSYSQENKVETTNQRAQCVFGELGGNGIIFSANYDLRFAKKQNGFGARAGLGFVASIFGGGLTVPIGLNYLAGKKSHYLEAGLGATIVTLESFSLFGEDVNTTVVAFVPGVGYRYQPLQNGFTGRIFVSPFISDGSVFWAGISAGYKF